MSVNLSTTKTDAFDLVGESEKRNWEGAHGKEEKVSDWEADPREKVRMMKINYLDGHIGEWLKVSARSLGTENFT